MNPIPKLFPKGDEWGTGDEALDLKLNQLLKKCWNDLSLNTIQSFYFEAKDIKPRVHNPTFILTIELLAKALLAHLNPDGLIDHELIKIKGSYQSRTSVEFHGNFPLDILFTQKHVRYKDQLDFFLTDSPISERNPFYEAPLKLSGKEFLVKIVFKDFKQFLSGEAVGPHSEKYLQDELFKSLKSSNSKVMIGALGEIWFYEDKIFSLYASR